MDIKIVVIGVGEVGFNLCSGRHTGGGVDRRRRDKRVDRRVGEAGRVVRYVVDCVGGHGAVGGNTALV